MTVIQFPKQPPPPGGFELPRTLVVELAQRVAGAVLKGCNLLMENAAGFGDLVAQTRAWKVPK